MVADVAALTVLVVMLNVPLVALAGTATLAGTCAAALLLDRLTETPPLGAAPFSITVPVEPCPPSTVAGFTVTDSKATFDAGSPVTLPHHKLHWLLAVLPVVLGPAYSCTVQKSVSLLGSTCVAL